MSHIYPDLPSPHFFFFSTCLGRGQLFVRQSREHPHNLSLEPPSFHKQHARQPQAKPLHHLHLHLHTHLHLHFAARHYVENIHHAPPCTDSGPSPCIRLPDPADSRASRPYQPPRPNPHLCPAVQRTDCRRALLRVAAVAPVPVRPSPPTVSPPWPPSRPVIFLSPSARHPLPAFWDIQSRQGRTV